jgi:peptidoglycan/LPS O-acetylase OafA/YrhL
MAQLVRCKSCGYITRQSRVGDVCPACGVPAKNMLAYTDPVSAKRRRILTLDIHPVVDHFCEAFSVATLVLAVAGLFIRGRLDSYLFDTLITLSFFTPLGVIASFATGMLDGKVRFRRVTTPILIKKMAFGASFFVFSVVMLFVALRPEFPTRTLLEVYLVFNIGAFICAFFLGLLGSGLNEAELPG